MAGKISKLNARNFFKAGPPPLDPNKKIKLIRSLGPKKNKKM